MESLPTKTDDELISIVWRIAVVLSDPQSVVSVEVNPGQNESTILLRVGPKDVGAIIGKQGRVARSIRTS